MTTIDWNAITILGGLAILTYYEIQRKFKKDKDPGMRAFFERNWPRVIFTAVLVPGAAQLILKWIKTIL